MAAVRLEILVVELLDARILVRSSQRSVGIEVVEALCPDFADIDEVLDARRYDRLSAAVHAAARTCHDLDEGVILLAGLDHLEDLAGVCEAGRDSDFYLEVAYLVGGFLDAFNSADILELEEILAEFLACDPLDSCTQGSFQASSIILPSSLVVRA